MSMIKQAVVRPDKTPSIFSNKKASTVSATAEAVHKSEKDKGDKLDVAQRNLTKQLNPFK